MINAARANNIAKIKALLSAGDYLNFKYQQRQTVLICDLLSRHYHIHLATRI